MISLQQYREKYPVYPGEYIPLLEPRDVEEEQRKRKDIAIKEPSINVNELPGLFEIEVAVPGVKREDFLVRVHENILSIIVVHKSSENNEGLSPKLHEFDNNFLERHILLPEEADAQLIQAEYNEGVLHFYLPKARWPSRSVSATIAVY